MFELRRLMQSAQWAAAYERARAQWPGYELIDVTRYNDTEPQFMPTMRFREPKQPP